MTPRLGACRPPLRAALGTRLLVAAMLLGGCSGVSDLQFRQDHRLQLQSPRNLSTVRLPLTVSWRMTGFTPASSGPVTRDRGRFAVFVDRYPMPPGQSLRSIVEDQPSCRGTDACLQPDYLAAAFGVYVTTQDEVTISTLPTADRQGGSGDGHYVTIVLLDAADNRIGESVWYASFGIAS